MVPSLDDVHLLVDSTSISLLPCQHVNILLFIVLVLFLLATVNIDVVTVLDLGLFG